MSTLSLYQASVPVFIRVLQQLDAVLARAEAHAKETGANADDYLQLRLAPDMFPLIKQIQLVSDGTKGYAARASQTDVPSMADTETTMAEAHARIAATLAFIQGIPAAAFDGAADRTVQLRFPGRSFEMQGNDYFFQMALPNVFFHLNMAYAILRHHGVPLGKMDYLGNMSISNMVMEQPATV